MPSKGILTFAIGADYARMAYALYLSTKQYTDVGFACCVNRYDEEATWLAEVGVPTVFIRDNQLLDLDTPFWFERYAYDLSPFDVTLKMDADCLFPKGCDVQRIFTAINSQQLVNGIPHNLALQPVDVSAYRGQDFERGLPQVYSTMFGFTKSTAANLFFQHIKQFYALWGTDHLPITQGVPLTTDSAYSLAWLVTKPTNCALYGTPFHHMKPATMGWDVTVRENWTQDVPSHMDTEGRVYVNGMRVILPMHYQDKTFMSSTILEALETAYVCRS